MFEEKEVRINRKGQMKQTGNPLICHFQGINRKGQMWETLIPWIIGVGVLVILIVLAVVFKDKLAELGITIKNLFTRG